MATLVELNKKPAASADDGWWTSDWFDSDNSDIRFGYDNSNYCNGFIRFPGITIPKGSTIVSAILRFISSTGQAGEVVNLNIYFNDVDDAVAPTTFGGANALALTAAVAWNAVPAWVETQSYDSPDLTAILQSVIDREGWASGQDIMAIVKNNGSTQQNGTNRYANTYDESTVNCTELRITFTSSDITAEPFELVISGTAVATVGTEIDVTAVPFEAVISGTADYELNNSGAAAATLPLLTCEAEGTVRSGVLEQDLPMFTIVATGQGGSVGNLDASLPMFQISASGFCGQLGNLDQILPQFTLSASGYTQGVGDADMDLPMFYIYASGHQTAAAVVAADYLVLAMNPKNMAVSEYDWSGFNSFAYFNGVYLGAKAGAIHVLGGDDDAGSIIESEIELGQIPMDSAKPRDVYVLGRAGGMMALTVMADEDTEKEVKIAYMLETLNLDRAKIPRGLQPTYFSLKLENRNGSDFDIDEIQVWGEIVGRGKP